MVATAHSLAISCYLAATALAAIPFARPVRAPVRWVVVLLALGVVAHGSALLSIAREGSAAPLTGLGPALSFAGFALAVALLIVELLAGEVSLTLAAAPLAALVTVAASVTGLHPLLHADGSREVWLVLHIALSFIGIAAYGTAAAAGTMYLVARHELKSRHFGAVFRFFPPLDTLDRVNHFSALTGFLGLTVGMALAAAYSFAYHTIDPPKVIWAFGAWMGISALALGRLLRGWQARRAAIVSAVTFVTIVVLYVVFRLSMSGGGAFL